MIRTLVEIQGGRVSIRETGTGQTEVSVTVDTGGSTGALGDRLYTSEEVGDLQASEAELVSAPLRRRVAELEAELSVATGKAHAFNLDRKSERDRADRLSELKGELERVSAQLRRRVTELEAEMIKAELRLAQNAKAYAQDVARLADERDTFQRRSTTSAHLLDTAKRQLTNVARAVAADRPIRSWPSGTGHIRDAMQIPWISDTIRDIQEMTAPWAPLPGTSGAEPTSQA